MSSRSRMWSAMSHFVSRSAIRQYPLARLRVAGLGALVAAAQQDDDAASALREGDAVPQTVS